MDILLEFFEIVLKNKYNSNGENLWHVQVI